MTLVLNSEDRDKKLSAQIAKDHHHQGTQNLTHTHTTACIFLHNFWLEIYHYFKPKLILTTFFSAVLPQYHPSSIVDGRVNVVNESSRLIEWSPSPIGFQQGVRNVKLSSQYFILFEILRISAKLRLSNNQVDFGSGPQLARVGREL